MSHTASVPTLNTATPPQSTSSSINKADETAPVAINEHSSDEQSSEFTQVLASFNVAEHSEDGLAGELTSGKDLPVVAETANQDLPEGVLALSLQVADKLTDAPLKSTATSEAVKSVLLSPSLTAQQSAPQAVSQTGLPHQLTQQAGLLKSAKPDSPLAVAIPQQQTGNKGLNLQTLALQGGETDKLFSAQMKNMLSDSSRWMNAETKSSTMPVNIQAEPASASSLRLHTMPPMMSETMSAAPQQTTLGETFGRPGWNQGMAKQVVWMVNQNIRSAEIRLNPANLGPVEVRVNMEDEQVSVAFSSRHAVVREAVEMSLPRLREMLESNGLNLAQADVSQHSFSEQRQRQAGNDMPHSSFAGISTSTADVSAGAGSHSAIPVMVNNGLVDYFA